MRFYTVYSHIKAKKTVYSTTCLETQYKYNRYYGTPKYIIADCIETLSLAIL